MSRPLLVCDCDEVLMHMVVPFGAWLAEDHDILFRMEDASFGNALKRRSCGTPLEAAEVWPLLDGFFAREMARQYPVAGAAEALRQLSETADIVILTNIGPDHAPARTRQLEMADMPYRVIGSRGGKGEPLAALIAEMAPSVTVFVDDLAIQHRSVAKFAPDVWRLHMVAEAAIADNIPASPHAHARIDDWSTASDWLAARLTEGLQAPILETDDD
jgi:hypothetical protein